MLAHFSRVILERAGPVHAVIRGAAATDPEIAAIRLQQQEFRLHAQTEFVRVLAAAGPLRNGMSIEEGGYTSPAHRLRISYHRERGLIAW